ncbi:uncharacterized protein K02A2.6-like [Wyeomyia smithii]|uniref:uncharacterized protein K02A2.6-like n=1 Tax=Wyeomyia smithii TaxID=174621 RepID=UPI002467B4D1|nr:uncharacterized protein K02A2.6-like [Wyeomyia smithii]
MVSIVRDAIEQIPVSFAAIQAATKTDKALQIVLQYIREGWPTDTRSITAPDVRTYFSRRESLTHVNCCILFHDRVVVPRKFRRQILKQFHRGHPGMVRMKSIARGFVFWPGIDNDIEEFVRNCTPCCTAGKAPVKTTLESWPIPDKPWSRIHVDYAGPVDGIYFLVVVDPYTKWPEVYANKSTTSRATTKMLSQAFATFGVPETIVSDNGTQFTSHEFQVFCEKQGIRHILTAPYHPQSNGLAERFVDTLKRTLRKIRSGGETLEEALQTFLQVYRTTPTVDFGNKSPAEIMLERPIRTVSSMLLPPDQTISTAQAKAAQQNEQFNKKQFVPGDLVYAQVHQGNSWHWGAATVIERIGRVNYNVLLQDRQRLIRSHIDQLKPRSVEVVSNATTSYDPLSIFVDGFGLDRLDIPAVQAVEPNLAPEEETETDGSHYFSDDSNEEDDPPQPDPVSIPVLTPVRPKRNIQLPARFRPYWMA